MKPIGLPLAAASVALLTTAVAAQPPQPPIEAAAKEKPAEPAKRAVTLPWSRIEQQRRGNRVVEITVVNAAGERRYTMVNREGAAPLSSQELSSGLSAPRFFKLEF